MPNIQRRSGVANNLVLREVDNLKIAQVTLQYQLPFAGAQEGPVAWQD